MQQASLATTAMAQYLAIPAGTAPSDVGSYANSLIARGCEVVVAAGPGPDAATAALAAANPSRHFLLVGNASGTSNTAVVAPTTSVTAAVAKVLTDAYHGRFASGTVSQ
jgi:basic membrane lipoprotein Med (substrate-binding protein (PBP1-ABC) superfamily)